MRFSSRSLAVAITVLVMLWGGVWLATYALAQNRLQAFAAAKGADFRYRLVGSGGNPLAVQLELADVIWRLPSGSTLTLPQVTLTLHPGSWRHYAVTSSKPFELLLPALSGTRLQLTAQGLDGQLTLHGNGRWASLAVTLPQAALAQTGNPPASPLLKMAEAQLRLEQPAEPPATHLESGLTLAFAVNDATLAPGLLRALPQQLTALTLNARVMGTPPDWRGLPMVESWRNAGGTLELDALDFTWGNLSGRVQATLALDKDAQPEGAGTAQLMLDSKTPTPTDAPVFNNVVQSVFGLMARTDPQTGVKSVTLPLALQQRQLALGIFPLAKVPDIRWGND